MQGLSVASRTTLGGGEDTHVTAGMCMNRCTGEVSCQEFARIVARALTFRKIHVKLT